MNKYRRVQILESHTALMTLTSYEANDIVAYDPTTGGRKRNLLRTIISPGWCTLLELQTGSERWESYVSRYEKKMEDELEIKLTGLESLVSEELKKFDPKLELCANIRWCAPGNRDACGDEVRSENSWIQVERHEFALKSGSHGCWCSQLSLVEYRKRVGVLSAVVRIFYEITDKQSYGKEKIRVRKLK